MARIPAHRSAVTRSLDPSRGKGCSTPTLLVTERDAGAGSLAEAYKGALDTGQAAYQTMLERASLGQLTVELPSFRIDAVNHAFCAMTGFSAAELIGHNAAILFSADQKPSRKTTDDLSSGATDGYSVERTLQRRDGTTVRVLWTVSAVRDDDGRPLRLLVVAQDLTREGAAEDARRRSQAMLDAAISVLPVTFTTMDTNLRFTSVAGGLDGPGTRPGDFLGKHVSEVTDDKQTLRSLQDALKGSTSTTRAVVNDRTYVAWHAPMRNPEGAIVGVISVSTNVTQEVATEAKRRQAEERALFAALHDPLTGLASRAALVEHVNQLSSTGHTVGALLLLDLDDFSLVNDSLGHAIGDAVLLEVASRVSDAFPGLMVARYGGDEFAVLASFAVDPAEAAEAAQRVHGVLDADVEIGGHAIRVTACVGIAVEQAGASLPALIRNADSALAHAKEAGAGQYRIYDAEMRQQVRRRLSTQAGLRAALRGGQLRLAYQPIIRLADRGIVGSEALLRWSDPDRGLLAPADFVPIAEKCGLIVPIGQWVMNTACDQAAPLERCHGTYVAVNVAARQLVGGGFAEWVEETLRRTGLPARALVVEVTESAFMDDLGPIRTAFDRLRSSGVRVAIDDFGTGYSSLARLQRLPVDVIKLDRAFVAGVDQRAEVRGMASVILELSAAIGADIVAEGVETEAEAATLVALGYTVAQGFLFGHPMPIEDLTRRLRAEALVTQLPRTRRAAMLDRARGAHAA